MRNSISEFYNYEDLYKQEVSHHIHLALQECLDYPKAIDTNIASFSDTGNFTHIADIYGTLVETTNKISDLRINYQMPSKIIEPLNESFVKRRLWSEAEWADKNLTQDREDFIAYLRRNYRIDLSDTDYLPHEFRETDINYSEYFDQQREIPTDTAHFTTEWPQEFSIAESLIRVLDHKDIPFVAGKTKAIIAPNVDNKEDINRDNIYFVDQEEKKYKLPEIFQEDKRHIVIANLKAYIDKSLVFQKAFLKAVERKIEERANIKQQEENMGLWTPGNCTTSQLTTLLGLVSENKRLTREEKAAIYTITSTFTKRNASKIIDGFIKEQKKFR